MLIKKTKAILFSLLIISFMFIITSCSFGGSGSDIAAVAELAARNSSTLTITDIRNDIPGIFNKYTRVEVEDIIYIINDAVNGQLAAKDYYEDVCPNISSSDIGDVYNAIDEVGLAVSTAANEEDEKKPANSDLPKENKAADKETEEESPLGSDESKTPIKHINSNLLLIIGIAAGVIVIVVVGIAVFLMLKKSPSTNAGTNTGNISHNDYNNNDNDGNYDDDDDYDDEDDEDE